MIDCVFGYTIKKVYCYNIGGSPHSGDTTSITDSALQQKSIGNSTKGRENSRWTLARDNSVTPEVTFLPPPAPTNGNRMDR